MRFMLLFCLTGFAWLLATPTATAQIVIRNSSSDTISNRINAQANLMKAEGERNRSLAEARLLFAESEIKLVEAASKKVDLKLKVMQNYWNMQEEYDVRKWNKLAADIENRRKPMVEQRSRVASLFDRAFSDPANSRYAVRNGNLFNFLLDQINAQQNGFLSGGDLSPGISANLPLLDDQTLDAIQVQTPSSGGSIAVSLTSPLPQLFTTWPFLFRDPDFTAERDAMTELAEQMLSRKLTPELQFAASEKFTSAFEAISSKFYHRYPPNKRKGLSLAQWRRINDAEAFLRRVNQTVMQAADADVNAIQRTAYTDAYPPEHRNIATLSKFMLQNGIEFGKAKPGTEFVYEQMIPQFRELLARLEINPNEEWIADAVVNMDLAKEVRDEPAPVPPQATNDDDDAFKGNGQDE
ncbi:secreted protein [Rhodopirellula maiorica SM1]|uniref:Secreted protein n=1 Tax=Rhodopirellula maiorica SM1 TaxID=1265738 RepID=M5RZZ5_9BACT|nr:hypothetical protein [Rhodopirellula maiorica]EMI19494.1 secreted protein [Rhodopirellula maiorica SM1]